MSVLMATSSRLFKPFPKENSTILIGNSNCGKTSYLRTLFEHTSYYFEVPISKIVIINYNDCVTFEPLIQFNEEQQQQQQQQELQGSNEDEGESLYSDPPIIETYLPGQINLNRLPKHAIVIFEDLQSINSSVLETVNMLNHHLHLAHVFIVTQGLQSTNTFSLIQFIHSIVFFLCNKSVTKFFRYLVSTIYKSPEVQSYLYSIINYCDDRDLTVHLLLNKSYHSPYHQLLIHVLKYHSHGYSVAFPFVKDSSHYQDVNSSAIKMSLKSDNSEDGSNGRRPRRPLTPPPDDLPSQAFVILDANRVKTVFAPSLSSSSASAASDSQASAGDDNDSSAAARKRKRKKKKQKNELNCIQHSTEWTQLMTDLTQWIESSIKVNQQLHAKRLVEALMTTPNLCVDAQFKKVKVDFQSNDEAVSILDFILLSIRRRGPSEKYNPIYAKCSVVAKAMIEAGTASEIYFINENILHPPTSKRFKRNLQQHQHQQQRQKIFLNSPHSFIHPPPPPPLPHHSSYMPSYYPPYWPPPPPAPHHG
jgi:hypothetical protein